MMMSANWPSLPCLTKSLSSARPKERFPSKVMPGPGAPGPFVTVRMEPSRVRLFTLIGGLTGVTFGYWMQIWMANDWPLVIGGKPFTSVVPYTIIGFELMILLGGLFTVLGLFAVARLPRFSFDKAYSARFSGEEIGLAVACRDRDVAEVEALLRDSEAKEVTLVEA